MIVLEFNTLSGTTPRILKGKTIISVTLAGNPPGDNHLYMCVPSLFICEKRRLSVHVTASTAFLQKKHENEKLKGYIPTTTLIKRDRHYIIHCLRPSSNHHHH